MLKQIECIIVESRPLEPCRSISHRQSDNCRQDRFSKPTRPDLGGKIPTGQPDFVSQKPRKPLASFDNVYPLGMIIDVYA